MERRSIVNPNIPYNYSRCFSALKRLVCRYKGLIRFSESGTSRQKRNIPSIILGRGEKRIFVLGAIHGREYVTTGYLLRCVEEYAENFLEASLFEGFDMREVLCEYSFHIVPMANPDSVEIALGRECPIVCDKNFDWHYYKDNARGVNLNANFPFCWQDVPKDRHKGLCPASERETRFIMNLCKKHNYEKALSFHSRGGCIYWRDAKNSAVKGDWETAQRIAFNCNLKLCGITESEQAYAGGFENWFRSTYKKPALCIELVNDENAPFDKCCSEFAEYTDFQRTKTALLWAL